MEFKHSVSILGNHYSIVFRQLLYFVLVTVVLLGISVGILLPAMDTLLKQFNQAEIFQNFGIYLKKIFTFEIAADTGFHALTTNYDAMRAIIDNNSQSLMVFYIIFIIMNYLYRFLMSLTSMPLSFIFHNFMESNLHYSLGSSIFMNIKKASRYSLATTLLNIPINAAIYFSTYYFIVGTVHSLNVFAFTLALLWLMLVFALKFALLSGWMPLIVVEDKGILEAFKEGFAIAKKNFSRAFVSSFMLYLTVFALSIVLGLPTFGIFAVLIIVSSMLMLRILELLFYYKTKGKRYYIDDITIAQPIVKINNK